MTTWQLRMILQIFMFCVFEILKTRMADAKKTHFINSQENLLIEFMKKHPKMVAGKYDNSYTYKNYVANWEELANILNAIPGGASKHWKSWRKTWQDKKSRAKKIKHGENAANKTGGGPRFIPTITETEEKWLEIIKRVAVEGDTSVLESSVADICEGQDTQFELIYEESDVECSSPVYNTEQSYENIIPNKPFKSQECSSVTHTKKSVDLATPPQRLEDQPIPKNKSKASEISSAVNHFKTVTVEENDIRRAYYREKLKKLDEIMGLKERKCKAIERLAEAVEKLS